MGERLFGRSRYLYAHTIPIWRAEVIEKRYACHAGLSAAAKARSSLAQLAGRGELAQSRYPEIANLAD